jgi:hypothetical protein
MLPRGLSYPSQVGNPPNAFNDFYRPTVQSPRRLHGGRVWMPQGFAPVPPPPSIPQAFPPVRPIRRQGEDRARRQRGWTVHWLPIPLEGAIPATGYNIYSNAGSNGPINYTVPVATVYALQYTTAPMNYPAVWKWGVRAFNAYGEEQNLDCAVTIILDANGNDITNRPLPPTGLRAVPQLGGFIRVEWYYPQTNGPKTPTGFHVYSGTGLPLSYTGPTTVLYSSGIANTFGIKMGPYANGTVEFFGVRAYNAVAEEPNVITTSAIAVTVGPTAVDGLIGTTTAEAG